MDLARKVHARWPNVLLVITSGNEKPSLAEIPDDGRFIAKPLQTRGAFVQVEDLMQKHCYDGETPPAGEGDCLFEIRRMVRAAPQKRSGI
jgi:hypothetical protein